MKKFLKYMIKPMAFMASVPSLGLILYWITERKSILITSIILYFGFIIGNSIKYFYTSKINV